MIIVKYNIRVVLIIVFKIFKLVNIEIFMFVYGISIIFENDLYIVDLVIVFFFISFNVSIVRLYFILLL